MVGILIIVTVGMTSLMKWVSIQNTDVSKQAGNGSLEIQVENGSSEWKTEVEGELAFIQTQLADKAITKSERKKLEGEEKVAEYRLANNIEPEEFFSREGMIKRPTDLSGTVLLLTVIVAAGIVASEFSQGTIKMLLTRPVKRWKILTAKFLTVNVFGILLMVIGYLVYILLALVLFKSGTGQDLIWNGKEVVEASVWGQSFYMLLLSFGSVFVTATFAFTVGSVFRSSSLAIGLSLFLYFTGSTISALLSQYEIAKYLLFTHMDLTQFETGMMLIPDLTMPFSLAVLTVYIIAFLVISFTTFVKRDVTA